MIVLYIISGLCLLGYILIIKDVFTKHPPLTPEEEKKQQAQLEADHRRTVQKLKETNASHSKMTPPIDHSDAHDVLGGQVKNC